MKSRKFVSRSVKSIPYRCRLRNGQQLHLTLLCTARKAFIVSAFPRVESKRVLEAGQIVSTTWNGSRVFNYMGKSNSLWIACN